MVSSADVSNFLNTEHSKIWALVDLFSWLLARRCVKHQALQFVLYQKERASKIYFYRVTMLQKYWQNFQRLLSCRFTWLLRCSSPGPCLIKAKYDIINKQIGFHHQHFIFLNSEQIIKCCLN